MDDIAGWGNTHCEANTTLKDYITSQQPYFFARPKFSSLIIMLFNIKKKRKEKHLKVRFNCRSQTCFNTLWITYWQSGEDTEQDFAA